MVYFHTSLGAQKFEQEIKEIKFVGTERLVRSGISKNSRPQIFMIRDSAKKDKDDKKGGLFTFYF